MLGLDQGTGSSRAILVDSRGKVHGLGTASVPRVEHPQGWIDQDPVRCLRSLGLAVRRLFQSSSADPHQVEGIGLACQRSTTVAFRRSDRQALLPAISWQCLRTQPWMETLSERSRKGIGQRSGLPVVAHYAASKMRWALDHVPTTVRRNAATDLHLGTLDSFLVAGVADHQEPRTDLSQATRTLLVELGQSRWSARHLRLFGLPRECLPPIVPSMGEYGRLRRGMLRPLRSGIPLLALAGDQQAALFASGMRQRGTAKITYGSGAFLLAPAGPTCPPVGEAALIRSVAWNSSSSVEYLYETNVPSAGSVFRWLERLTGTSIDELLRRASAKRDWLEALQPLLFFPSFAGLGPLAPHLGASGRIDGLTHGDDGPRLALSLAAGIGAALAEGTQSVERALGRRLATLLVDGGSARDRRFLQLQSDVLHRALTPAREAEGTAFGAAAMAWQAAGSDAPRISRATPTRPRLSAQRARTFRQCWRRGLDALIQDFGDSP